MKNLIIIFLSMIISSYIFGQTNAIDSLDLKFPTGFPNEIKGVELSKNKRYSLAYSSTYGDDKKYTVKVHDIYTSNELFSADGIEFDKIELNKVSNKSYFYSSFSSGIINVQKFNNELDSVKNIEIGKIILNFKLVESRLINVILEDEIRLYDFSGKLLKKIKTASKIVNTCYSSGDNIILISENGVISIFDPFNLQLINSFASIPLNDLHKNEKQLWNELSDEIKYSITGQSSNVYPTESRIKSKVETYFQENKILKLDYSRNTNKLICYRKTKTNIFYNSNDDIKIFTSELVNKDWGFRKNTQYNSENESIYFLKYELHNKEINILHLDSFRYEKMTFPEEILFYTFWNNQKYLKIKTKNEAYFYDLIDGKYILEKKIIDNEQLDWNGSTLKNSIFSDLWLVINQQPELDFIKRAIDSKTLITNHIGAVKFSNDEKFMIIAGGFDFQLIELETLRTLIKSRYPGKESSLVFSPCSQFLFFQSYDTLKIYNLNNLKYELSVKLDDDCADWGSEWRINIPKSLIVFSLKTKNNNGLVKLFSFSKTNIYPKNLCSFGNNNEMFFDDFIDPSFSRDNNSLFLKSAHKLFIHSLVNQCQKDSIFLEFPKINVTTSKFRGEYERTIKSSEGVKSGYGEQFENNKLIYQGNWKYNYKHGKGKFFYDNGTIYEGDFKFDKKSGFGTLYFSNGDKYEGEFFNDKRNGKGKYFWANGVSKEYFYVDGTENDFNNKSICISGDCQNGTGILKFSSGNIYQGGFSHGMKNGYAKEITSDGIVYYEGDYLNNVRHGFGFERDSKGKVIYEGPFTEGVKLGFRRNNFGQECLVNYGFASEESAKLPINNLIQEIIGAEALFLLQGINEIDSNVLMLLFGENTDNSNLISSQVMLFNLNEKKVIGIINNQPKINDLETELNRTYPSDVAFNDSTIAIIWSSKDRKTYESKHQLTLYNINTLHKNEINYKIPKSYVSLFMHKNSKNLIINLEENSQLNLNLIDFNIKNFHSSVTSSPNFSSSINILALWDAEWEGSIQNSDIEFFNDGKKVFSVYYFGVGEENFDFLIKLKSGYYFSPKSITKLLYYINKKSGRRIGFEQLDPIYNRPDIVLDSIGKYFGGADNELVANYRQSWEKRIDRLGLDKEKLGKGEIAVPNAEIVASDDIAYENKDGKLNIKVSGNDSKYPIRRFNVFVNEVPLYGSAGISIAHLKKQVWDTTVSVPLSVGENKIQVSVMNELGLENFKYPTYVNYTPTKEIVAKTYYIGIGVNAFKDSSHNLNFCVKDVRDLAKAFSAENKSIDTLLFTDKQVTKENILALKDYLNKTSVNDKVIISCSSHGLLDDSLNFYLAMQDVDFNNPKARGLKYEELESLLDGIPARQKLLLLDACNSGENDKTELMKEDLSKNQHNMNSKTIQGARSVIDELEEKNKSNFKKMNELFVNVRNNTGSVIISAAGGQESALEAISVNGKTIENGAFTYSILECLKQNEGKELKVNTLKKYAEKRVEEITNGKQKPTSRQETMEVDWQIK